MRRPYRELGKPFGLRIVELIHALQLIADSVKKVREGEARYLIVLSGQLRSLVAEKSRGATPLLLDIAEKLGKEFHLYCMPDVQKSSLPHELKDKITLHVAGFPVTSERQLLAQTKMPLAEFLDKDLIQLNENSYSARAVIEWYANKAGGAHYSSKYPEDIAELLSVNLMNIQAPAQLLLQIGEAVLASGRRLLKSVVDFEIYALVVVPRQEPGAITPNNYLIDLQYEGSLMRISLVLDANLTPCFFVAGLQGAWLRVVADRMADWSEPRVLHATLFIEDDLSTTVELAIDGTRVGRVNVHTPLFVLADPLDYGSYHNKAADGDLQQFTFGLGEMIMAGKELEPKDRASMLLYLIAKRSQRDLRVMSYSPGAFAHAPRGTKDMTVSGVATQESAYELLTARGSAS